MHLSPPPVVSWILVQRQPFLAQHQRRGYAGQDQPLAQPLDTSSQRLQHHTFSAAQALYLAPEPVVGFVSCAASEKVVLELPSCKPGEPVHEYLEIWDRDAWQSPDRDRQHSPRRGECGHNFGCRVKRCLAPSDNVPSITWRSSIMVETP